MALAAVPRSVKGHASPRIAPPRPVRSTVKDFVETSVAVGIDPMPWWPVALDYLERMGALAAKRLAANPVLRPIGDCDVATLLGSRSLREALCAADGTGMRAAAVPMLRRGWLDLSRIDPAFTAAAAAATTPEERGFTRPLLLTADEVALAPDGGRPAEIVLRDDAVETPHLRSVLYR